MNKTPSPFYYQIKNQQISNKQNIGSDFPQTQKNTHKISAIFQQHVSNYNLQHSSLVSQLKQMIDRKELSRAALEQFCLRQFQKMPLFLMGEISECFQLFDLKKMCEQELIGQNFEQLNYLKLDLMRCSVGYFREVLNQYLFLSNGLEIQGLRQSDLKLIVENYCEISDIGVEKRMEMEREYIYGKKQYLDKKSEVRKSMIDVRGSTPMRARDRKIYCKTPQISRIPEFNNFDTELSTEVFELRKQIEGFNQSQKILHSNIIKTKQQCMKKTQEKQINQILKKINSILISCKKQVDFQDGALKSIWENVEEIKRDSSGTGSSGTGSKQTGSKWK